jgi:parallel beta-helix repeat protein
MLRFFTNSRSPRKSVRPRLECLEDRLTPSTLTVGDTRASNAKNNFISIQTAINAAKPGDDIRVYPGTYTEQLTIGAGEKGLTIEAATGTEPVVTAPATLTGNDAVIDISSSQNIRIEGLSIKGNASTAFGIRVDTGASAEIDDNTISSILGGNGAGIFVGQSSAKDTTSGHAEIEGNKISNYNKVGIAVNGANYSADIERNTVIGAGADFTVSQNGIQIADGANGDIERNNVSGNIFTGTGFNAAGILLSGAGSHTEVERNYSHGNQEGIFVYDSKGAEVDGNTSDKNTADGITIVDSADIDVYFDRTFKNGGDGVSVYGGNAAFPSTGNTIAYVSSYDNTGNGINLETTSKFALLGNIANGNGGSGILLDKVDHGVVLGNSAGNNTLSGILLTDGSTSNKISANDASKNKVDGIAIVDSTGNTISANIADSNGHDGISETEPLSGSVDNTYANNSARGNKNLDFDPTELDVKKKPK